MQYKNLKFVPIVGCAGDYMISACGKVLSLKGKAPRILKPANNSNGYPSVSLCIDELGKKSRTIHRLVATAFLRKSKKRTQVNHIDGVKTNPVLENLEWCTAKENVHHSLKMRGYM